MTTLCTARTVNAVIVCLGTLVAAQSQIPANTQQDRTMPESRPTNRLIDESSPYLLQHAHNPVDWRPWGPEAFAEARARDVPIFLSIGYSTCYWCHVMERESFEDEATAKVMEGRATVVEGRARRRWSGRRR